MSEQAAKIKNIDNEVAGKADIILVPNLETGNSLSKMMVYFMNACAAGIVIGGKTPVVVPSRADSKNSKIASIMAAVVAIQNWFLSINFINNHEFEALFVNFNHYNFIW